MSFALEFRRSAQRELEALHPEMRSRIQRRIDGLAENVHPHDALKLHGSQGLWRIRVGDYRVLYEIDMPGRRVVISTIRHRGEAYRER